MLFKLANTLSSNPAAAIFHPYENNGFNRERLNNNFGLHAIINHLANIPTRQAINDDQTRAHTPYPNNANVTPHTLEAIEPIKDTLKLKLKSIFFINSAFCIAFTALNIKLNAETRIIVDSLGTL